MTTTLKLELLNDALDTNGIGLDLPANAIGVVGPEVDSGFKVMRAGQEVAVKPGTVLLKGDIIRTGSMAQTIYLSSTQAVAMTKVALAANQQLNMDTTSVLALEGDVVEVAATDALNPDLLAMGEGDLSGLFGALGAASIAGVPLAPVAAGGLAIAALGGSSGSGDSGSSDAGTGSGNTGTPNTDNGDTGGAPADQPAAGGPFSSGGSQIDGGLAATPLGGALPFSFADGGAMLEGALPIPAASSDSGSALPVNAGPAAIIEMVESLGAPLPQPVADLTDVLSSLPAGVSSAADMLPASNNLQPALNLI